MAQVSLKEEIQAMVKRRKQLRKARNARYYQRTKGRRAEAYREMRSLTLAGS